MFIKFSVEKHEYERGQIFPFLVGVIAVLIILAMITVNLGQIGIFKTDTSNAADAAALSAGSVLSQSLLGYGIKSDEMAGRALEHVVFSIAMTIAAILSVGWATPALIAGIITFTATQLTTFLQADLDSKMAFQNAKKTAILYAFQNVGVDQPRTSFEEFLNNIAREGNAVWDSATVEQHYACYTRGDLSPIGIPRNPCLADDGTPLPPSDNCNLFQAVRRSASSGFSRFMRDDITEHGYWPYPRPNPQADKPDETASSAYGWGLRDERGIEDPSQNSYEYTINNPGANPNDPRLNPLQYDNYVSVTAKSPKTYHLYPLLFGTVVADCVGKMISDLHWPWYVEFIVTSLINIISTLLFGMLFCGLTFHDFLNTGIDTEEKQTDKNYITVTVDRHKANNDLGLWTFRYPGNGRNIQSTAVSHVFRDNPAHPELITIEPILTTDACALIQGTGTPKTPQEQTQQHLFETELISTK